MVSRATRPIGSRVSLWVSTVALRAVALGEGLRRDRSGARACNCEGVFAAGDVRYGSVKRVASAVGNGSIAVDLCTAGSPS